MAGKTFTFTVPRWTANLGPNLLGLVSLATICVMVGCLTDWRWGGLLAGVFGLVLAVWLQWSAPAAEQDNVRPLKKAA